MLRQTDHVEAGGRRDAGVGIGEDVQLAAPRAHFLHVGLELFQQRVVRRHRDDRHLARHQGEGAVLQLAGGIGLGMDVGDLLQLERTLERNRVMQAAPEEERVLTLRELLGPGDDRRLQSEH